MTWRDNTRTASFRGIQFQVPTVTTTIGRRLARHEYPQRDLPYLEDMGRKAREYKVEGFVIGSDYMARRDALTDAIEKPGAGQLVHPWYGTVVVTVDSCDLVESTAEGGYVKFSITFVEAGKRENPTITKDTRGGVSSSIADAKLAVESRFSSAFATVGAAESVVTDAVGSVSDLVAVPGMLTSITSLQSTVPLLAGLLPDNITASVLSPLALAASVIALAESLPDVSGMLNYSNTTLPSVTQSAITRNANREAFTALVQQAATLRYVSDTLSVSPPTVDDARSTRADIMAKVDSLLLDSPGSVVTTSLVAVRTAAFAHLSAIAPQLPRLVSVPNRTPLHAVVIAHDFYGDQWISEGRAAEIVIRNRVRHPGFVPGGIDLQMESRSA